MKAIQVHQTGGPEVLRLETIDEPEPKEGEVKIKLRAIGVNYIDTYHREGLYKLPLPFTPGVEGAGEVTAAASNVGTVRVGDRVAFAMSNGSYAQYICVPASKLVVLSSEAMTEEIGASMLLQGLTAQYLTRSTFPLKAGQIALVHAAAGGVGQLLVQVCKLLGARVIGTASTEDKAKLARDAGADSVINYSESDFEKEVKKLTNGDGVDVVYESVGKVTFEKSLNCLKPRGYLVLFGQSSGPVQALDPQTLNAKGSLYLTRPSLAHYIRTREELDERSRELMGWISSGKLKVRIGARYKLEDAQQAHRDLQGRRTTGKILLIP